MLGGTIGAAVLGAVLNSTLHARFAGVDAGAAAIENVHHMFDRGVGQALTAVQRAALADALGAGLSHAFVALAVFGALTLVATWWVPSHAIFASRDPDQRIP